ncbi:NAD(P)-binding protein [Thozetella sp. PMI_491]|nr:NAD(P)-binding protein [Thozetella sp. PMI_491]
MTASTQSPRGRILVTGANGFIAAYCVAELLQRNYAVVGTVRNATKAAAVAAAHKHHPALSTYIVEDISSPDGYGDAIQDCDGVLHLAAPFSYDIEDPEQEMLIPSIRGTEAICLAASKVPSVKRIVLTSSFAAVYDASKGLSPGTVYRDDDWSPLTYQDGLKGAPIPQAYRASKKLAEETAWQFLREKRPHWELVTLCPGMVFGPAFSGTLESPKALNTSNQLIWGLVDATEMPPTKAPLWTSVTGLATAHVNALEAVAAAGERLLFVNGNYDMQELADIIHASPSVPASIKARVPTGSPENRLVGKVFTSDSSKASQILSMDLDESLADTVVELVLQVTDIEARDAA